MVPSPLRSINFGVQLCEVSGMIDNAKLLLILQDENEGSLTSHLDTELGKKNLLILWNEYFGIVLAFPT